MPSVSSRRTRLRGAQRLPARPCSVAFTSWYSPRALHENIPVGLRFGGRRVYRGWRIAHSRPWHHGGHRPAPRPATRSPTASAACWWPLSSSNATAQALRPPQATSCVKPEALPSQRTGRSNSARRANGSGLTSGRQSPPPRHAGRSPISDQVARTTPTGAATPIPLGHCRSSHPAAVRTPTPTLLPWHASPGGCSTANVELACALRGTRHPTSARSHSCSGRNSGVSSPDNVAPTFEQRQAQPHAKADTLLARQRA
jgi:hypothetical protein